MNNFPAPEAIRFFQVTHPQIGQFLNAALSKGGDFCDIFFQHSITQMIGMEDNLVNKSINQIEQGVGIRVLKGDQTGYSFTEDLNNTKILDSAKTAAAIANSSGSFITPDFSSPSINSFYSISKGWEDISLSKKIELLTSLNERALKKDSRITKTSVWLTSQTSRILIANSEGKMVSDYQPLFKLVLNVVAESKGTREQMSQSISFRHEFDFITDEKLDNLVNETVENLLALFEASKPEGGQMEVVLAAGNSGILLHEAIGHGMEADFNRKNTSIFSDKMNKKVAADFITIVDNGTNPHIRGSINIDDEGNDSRETTLVENGILKSYLHDRISAKWFGVAPTGNGRRESFRHTPLPRMRNTYMINGPHDSQEIIESVKKGIYCQNFTNGQVHIGGGDFTFYVKNGYLIENGKLTQPIKDINIIGNGPEVLSNIVMAGNDFKLSEGGWTCGKDGQSVPVSQGMPTVKVNKLTVGGN